MVRPASPLSQEPLEEIPLGAAPLARVLCQVRYANMAIFQRENFIAPFIEQLLDEYPLLEEGKQFQLTIDQAGPRQEQSPVPVWMLRSIDQAWTVTVSPGSLALETLQYSSRSDFVARFARARRAFSDTLGTSVMQRLGVRYINRLDRKEFDNAELASFLYSDTHGPLTALTVAGPGVFHGISDLLLKDGDEALQGKWGVMPANVIYDPAIAVSPSESWFLDIDSYSSESGLSLSDEKLDSLLEHLATRAYHMFRWFVTPEFLHRFEHAADAS